MARTLDNDNAHYRGINYWTAMILGWVLLLVGFIGFVWDPVLGLFEVGLIHNVIHILSGAVLLAGAYMNGGLYARPVNLTLGIVYVLVALLGFFAPALLGSIIQYNMADNWLHTFIAVVLIAVSFAERHVATRPIAGAPR